MPAQVATVWTDCMPTYETSSVSADLSDPAGRPLKVSMRKLAGLDPADDGFGEISNLVAAYHDWIAKLENVASRQPAIPADLEETARLLIGKCKDCLARIEDRDARYLFDGAGAPSVRSGADGLLLHHRVSHEPDHVRSA